VTMYAGPRLLLRARAVLPISSLSLGPSVRRTVNHQPERRVREIRMHGVEGGGTQEMASSLPLSRALCSAGSFAWWSLWLGAGETPALVRL
jgi:hypothetical protein